LQGRGAKIQSVPSSTRQHMRHSEICHHDFRVWKRNPGVQTHSPHCSVDTYIHLDVPHLISHLEGGEGKK